jgi:hypothetical protein
MKWQLLTIGLLGVALCGCGSEGNPNGSPYAGEAGGTVAVKPQTVGVVSYQPYAKAAPFEDMKAGAPVSPNPNAMPAPPPPLR